MSLSMSERRALRGCHLRWLFALIMLLGQSVQTSALAESTRERVLVLDRASASFPESLRARVDAALQGSLAQHPEISAERSEMPLDDVAIAAGCNGADDSCRQEIAGTVDAQWLLVRELVTNAAGVAELRLSAHRHGQVNTVRRAQSTVTEDGPTAPENVVAALVSQLFPYGEARAPREESAHVEAAPVAPAEERAVAAAEPTEPLAPRPTPSKKVLLRATGWTLAVVGCSLLAAGATLGGISRSDHNEYADMRIRTDSDVDRARGLLDQAQERARRANGLLIGGAVAAAAGLTSVIVSMALAKPEREQRVTWNLSPQHRGATVTLAGAWGGIR